MATVVLIRRLLAAALGLAGLGLGLQHVHDVAAKNGQLGWRAWAVAVATELVVLVAALHIKSRLAEARPTRVPVAYGSVGFVFSMVCQVVDAPKTPMGWLVAAVPVLFFLGAALLEEAELGRAPAKAAAPPARKSATQSAKQSAERKDAGGDVALPVASTVALPAPSERKEPEPAAPVPARPTKLEGAVAAALAYRAEHGRLPTPKELEPLAGAGNRTCVTALKQVRDARPVKAVS